MQSSTREIDNFGINHINITTMARYEVYDNNDEVIMETIKICKISPENGYEDGIAEYNGKLSAVYALCLYVCQRLWHTDYLNKRMIEKARSMITLGKSNKACYFWANNDVTYSAIATSGKDAITGEFGSKYDYEPNYPTKC